MTDDALTTIRHALTDQGRSIKWLAKATDAKPSLVYAYTCGRRRPAEAWLVRARAALGLEEPR